MNQELELALMFRSMHLGRVTIPETVLVAIICKNGIGVDGMRREMQLCK